jgi:hypothetical protein
MQLEALMKAIDTYAEAQRKLQESFTAPDSDWDCGLSLEFDTPIAIANQREELQKAKAALDSALEGYVSSRIEAFLKEHGLSRRQG